MDCPGPLRPQLCQSRQRLSLLPLLRERALGNCLPMAICQWRRALAVAKRGRGLGTGGRVPVLVRVLAALQGRGEAEDRAVGQAVALQPAP